MNCGRCADRLAERKASQKAPYYYELGGGFALSGITVLRCPTCGNETPMIPKIAQLHRKMAEILVAKPSSLTGAEIRFLRKNAGFPANKFAALIGVSAPHLSRVENSKEGHESLGPSADKLARLLGVDGGNAREELLKLAAQELESRSQGGKQIKAGRRAFTLIRGSGWQEAA